MFPRRVVTRRAATALSVAVTTTAVLAAAALAQPASALAQPATALAQPATAASGTLWAASSAGVAARSAAVGAGSGGAATKGGQLVRAGGQVQWIECRGKVGVAGRPTVVLVSGLGAGHHYWGAVPTGLAATGRVCWYDRPGLGNSSYRRGPSVVSAADHAAELVALLARVGETSPMIFVGHSYGGLLVRAVGTRYPGLTAGMVLVDASYSKQWQTDSRYWPEGGGWIDMAATGALVYRKPQLGSKPLGVITAGIDSSDNWRANQAYMATLSRNSFQVTVPNASHVVMATHANSVIRAVNRVRTSVRHQRPMPPCNSPSPTYWSQVGAYCGS
jgi:alpha-beta hydrolase superfamily lysophospholipase